MRELLVRIPGEELPTIERAISLLDAAMDADRDLPTERDAS
jgi:hypothetical protein